MMFANNFGPLVSVIVTTKNEEANIEACLRSISSQTYKNIETIVVDNNSTDLTKDIARLHTDNVFNRGPERSVQRNFGASVSNGKYIMYIDADMILNKSLISECVAHSEKTNIEALYIPEIIMGDSFLSKIRKFERGFYNGTVIDCVRFIKRSAFVQACGFDTTLTGPEDFDLDKRLKSMGAKFSIIKDSCIYHNEADINLKSYLDKKSYYAKSFDKYRAKWHNDDEDIKKQLGFYYRFIGVFIENKKWKELLKHPILTVGMYYLRFRVGLRYLRRNNARS